MASIIARIKRFAASPQGRQARAKAEQMARDPRNQARLRQLRARFSKRR
jgi:hypothetical protein